MKQPTQQCERDKKKFHLNEKIGFLMIGTAKDKNEKKGYGKEIRNIMSGQQLQIRHLT